MEGQVAFKSTIYLHRILATILNVTTVNASSDNTGEVLSGYLLLRCCLLPVDSYDIDDTATSDNTSTFDPLNSLDIRFCLHTAPHIQLESALDVPLSYAGQIWCTPILFLWDDIANCTIYGLLLMNAGNKTEFRRVGIFEFDRNGKFPEEFSAPETEITII